jgi:DNA primase
MSYERSSLPDPLSYYESEGLRLTSRGKWRTTECRFHGGTDSMRINTESGAFVCMAGCGARGGDVLAHHMAAHGLEFVEAAKALGAWVDNGKPNTQRKLTPISPRQALEVLSAECSLVAVAAGNVSRGVILSDSDRARVLTAANRINRLVEVFA